jgi:hypothetical protein
MTISHTSRDNFIYAGFVRIEDSPGTEHGDWWATSLCTSHFRC